MLLGGKIGIKRFAASQNRERWQAAQQFRVDLGQGGIAPQRCRRKDDRYIMRVRSWQREG